MSTRVIDSFTISMEISALGMRLGALEGQARERGYPLLPDSRLVDCGKLVLSVFDKHREQVGQMRVELDAIYYKLRSISTDFEGVCVPELKEVFEGQVKLLHEKRGVLTHSFNAFDALLSSHVLIQELEKGIGLVRDQVVLFESGKMGVEKWESINNSIEDLLLRLRIVFPDSNKGAGNFCELHNESKEKMLSDLRKCRLDLDWKKSELLEKSRSECKANLEVLLPALDKMRREKISDLEIKKIQKLFGSLPLDLRTLLFSERKILSEDQQENAVTFFTPVTRGASSEVWAEVRGLSYYDSERNLNNYNQSVNEILGREGGQRETLASERERAGASLNQFVAELPEDEIKNPKLLLEALSQICYENDFYKPKSAAVLEFIEAVVSGGLEEVEVLTDAAQPENLQEVFETRLQNTPALNSLKSLKEQVEAYREARCYDAAQRERLVAALLDAAESKGGVLLNVDKGVYYWIWFLAHEKDPKAGGDNFGKNNAPKDLDRLILAIEKSMPAIEPPVKTVNPPVVKIESVSSPLSQPVRLLEVFGRRGVISEPYKATNPLVRVSSPRPVARPLKPSEVVKRERSLSASPSPIGIETAKSKIMITSVPSIVVTEVKIKCSVPEGHFLYIRGQGGDLNWNVGKKLVKVDEQTYVHKMEGVTGKIEYKVVLDDKEYEAGGNRVIEAQKSQEIVPSFQMPKVAAVVNFAPKDNKLFVCGTGPGMSWDQNKKMELKLLNGKFLLEAKTEMGSFEFKILQSNNLWSKGVNFKAEKGKTIEITPAF